MAVVFCADPNLAVRVEPDDACIWLTPLHLAAWHFRIGDLLIGMTTTISKTGWVSAKRGNSATITPLGYPAKGNLAVPKTRAD